MSKSIKVLSKELCDRCGHSIGSFNNCAYCNKIVKLDALEAKILRLSESDRLLWYKKLYKRYSKSVCGGWSFGLDWSTLSVLRPHTYQVMRLIAIQENLQGI